MKRARTTTWVHVNDVSLRQCLVLRERFPMLDERDLRDVLPPQQRPKYVERDDYRFIVLLLPWFDRERRALTVEEVDIFLLPQTVITMHSGHIPVFGELQAHVVRKDGTVTLPESSDVMLELLERLLDYCAPILVHLQSDIDEQEGRVSEHFHEREISKTAILRRNVVSFNRAFTPDVRVIEHLCAAFGSTNRRDLRERAERVADKTIEIMALLADFSIAIGHIHETQQALVTHRTNRVTTALTVIAVLTFPISMLASIFSIGAGGTPFVDRPEGFWIIASGLATIGVVMFAFFKFRRWF